MKHVVLVVFIFFCVAALYFLHKIYNELNKGEKGKENKDAEAIAKNRNSIARSNDSFSGVFIQSNEESINISGKKIIMKLANGKIQQVIVDENTLDLHDEASMDENSPKIDDMISADGIDEEAYEQLVKAALANKEANSNGE